MVIIPVQDAREPECGHFVGTDHDPATFQSHRSRDVYQISQSCACSGHRELTTQVAKVNVISKRRQNIS
jgi:hypothetical protein